MWILTLVLIMHLSYGDRVTIQNYEFNSRATCLIGKDEISKLANQTMIEKNISGITVYGDCLLPLPVKEKLK